MIPLRDDIPTETFPFVTIFLIAANCLSFFYQLSLGPGASEMIVSLGVIPFELTSGVDLAPSHGIASEFTLFSSMFLHANLFHLGGNMMFLWIFGNNVEDSTGHLRFILFYILTGLAAAGLHIWLHPESKVPLVGASGAVSGILGAYFLLYPRARVLTLVLLGFFFQTFLVPASIFLGIWFLLQFLSASLSFGGQAAGVAWFAHVGGFVAGMPLLLLMKKKKVRLWSRQTGWERR